MAEMNEDCCPNCGECDNLHINYNWDKPNTPIEEYLCNECGTYFKPKNNE
jgi:formate dehydrogenase maturation protein FdhE